MKKLISCLQQSNILKWTGEVVLILIGFALKALAALCMAIGGIWLAIEVKQYFDGPPAKEIFNIILDESKLVRCRSIDRSQPACTLISECEDGVDRCVGMFEVLRRPASLGDFLPTEE